MKSIDKQTLVLKFRNRLAGALEDTGLSQSAFCRLAHIDRSTLNQLLTSDQPRLPRADTIAAIATTLHVSTDWLLGLSQETERGAEILEQKQQIARSARSPIDELILSWLEESQGLKIRYVPFSLPDQMRIEEVSEWEYEHFPQRSPRQANDATMQQIQYIQQNDTDFEVCSPLHSIECLALGQGHWRGLERSTRVDQIETMIQLAGDLYPSYRWYLYDNRAAHSAPMTIFGAKRATVYIGGMYFVYNTTDHIRALTRHFDDLIRAASVQAHEIGDYLEKLLMRI